MEIKVTVVYSSRFGHTRLLAEHFADGVRQEPGAEAELVTAGEALRRLDEFDRADAIALGSPTYMGNLSAEIKTFMEACSGRWASRAWSGKVAGGFTNSSSFSGDKFNTMVGLVTFALQMGMIWVGVDTLPGADAPEKDIGVIGPGPEALNRNCGSLGVMATSFNARVPAAPPPGDLRTAVAYGRRLAVVTGWLKAGRPA